MDDVTIEAISPIRAVELAISDQGLRRLYRMFLGFSCLIFSECSIEDVMTLAPSYDNHFLTDLYDNRLYCIVRPALVSSYLRLLRVLSSIILCAANNYMPACDNIDYDNNIPISIPRHCLAQLGLPFPCIVLFQNPAGTFQNRRFLTPAALVAHVNDIHRVCQYFLFWIADAMRTSIEHGMASTWNWGAPIGLPWPQFLERATRHTSFGGYSPLTPHLLNRDLQQQMDAACARLFCLSACRLQITARSARLSISADPAWTEVDFAEEAPNQFVRRLNVTEDEELADQFALLAL